jgi:hypothetical protein
MKSTKALLMCGFLLGAIVGLLGGPDGLAQGAKADPALKGKYQRLEVDDFTVQEGIDFPADGLGVLRAEIVQELVHLRRFKQVSDKRAAQPASETKTETAEPQANTPEPTLRLVGTITKYKPGSRAKRYLIGFGAGATKVVAHIKFVDAATGNVLFEKDVDGKVIIGFFGGESSGATRGLAKEVAKVAKKTFF